MVKMGKWSIGNIKCEWGECHLTCHFFIEWVSVEQAALPHMAVGVMYSGNQHILFTERGSVFCDEMEEWREHISLGTEESGALLVGLEWMWREEEVQEV